MNTLLELKKTFDTRKNSGGGGGINLPANKEININHLKSLLDNLVGLQKYWSEEKDKYFSGILIQVQYKEIIAKSNRLSAIFNGNSTIVGAKFNSEKDKHIITHCIKYDDLDDAINLYKTVIEIFERKFNGVLTTEKITQYNNDLKKNIQRFNEDIDKTKFFTTLVNSYYIEKFFLETYIDDLSEQSLITIYKTGSDTQEIMQKIGITQLENRILFKTTLRLTPDEIKLLKTKAPYLVSMATTDLCKLSPDDFEPLCDNNIINIPLPSNEPTIGVIDTLFSDNVYFSEWVEYVNMVDPAFEITPRDYEHGTAVSSIIVDGASSNPNLDDGCGRFKVKHFGVALSNGFSSFSILKMVEEIILKNKDIKVWNFSLGSIKEIHPNFISPEAAFFDRLQYENDIIFVIAGTNNNSDKEKFIGSPADSINSVVVNAVNSINAPASYSRKGPVLSFFTKPDVACFGGDTDKKIRVCTPTGECYVCGTSFAAPWISRKLGYMIYILGLSREVAKALLVHSALSWKESSLDSCYVGHGIIPKNIQDIVQSANDEIRFVILGTSKEYYTYTYTLPVPFENDKYPFIAKATLCYFPACSRNQGVDYTNTEFEFGFGRIKDTKDSKGKFSSIEKKKYHSRTSFLHESEERDMYRKWDNVKNLLELETGKNKAKKMYQNPNWGIQITSKERLDIKYGNDLSFGIVVTLKELTGKNRIDEFIQLCALRGWLVNKIDIQTRINIHAIAEEEISFDED